MVTALEKSEARCRELEAEKKAMQEEYEKWGAALTLQLQTGKRELKRLQTHLKSRGAAV